MNFPKETVKLDLSVPTMSRSVDNLCYKFTAAVYEPVERTGARYSYSRPGRADYYSDYYRGTPFEKGSRRSTLS